MPEIEADRQEQLKKRRDQLQRVWHGLQETTNIMHRVMNDMMERGETVEQTLEKSDALMHSSHNFRRVASPWYTRWCLDAKAACRYCWAKTGEFIRRPQQLAAACGSSAEEV